MQVDNADILFFIFKIIELPFILLSTDMTKLYLIVSIIKLIFYKCTQEEKETMSTFKEI